MPRGYTVESCIRILTMTLEAEDAVRRDGPDPGFTMITAAQMQEIRRLNRDSWREGRDWPHETWIACGRPSLPEVLAMTGTNNQPTLFEYENEEESP